MEIAGESSSPGTLSGGPGERPKAKSHKAPSKQTVTVKGTIHGTLGFWR